MVLVDTSVLIDFFRNVENDGTRKLELLVATGVNFGINGLIYLEVLQGASSKSDYQMLKNYLGSQIFYGLAKGKDSYSEAAELYLKCRSAGITVRSQIDLRIVQTAIENGLLLLHNDRDYAMIQKAVPGLEFY